MQPEDVLPGDIDANLGAPWIPETDIQYFAAELFGVAPYAIQIGHLKKDALWSVDGDNSAKLLCRRHHRLRHRTGKWALVVRAGPEPEIPAIYDTL